MVTFTEEAFGAKLLEAVTAGLYDGNLNCLREYVQNSIDSQANRIDVYFENNRINLIVQDDGCGMDRQGLIEALYLGKSEKTDTAIGWRGIGIWSGIPACRKIVIITKKQNHPKYRIEIDADKLRDQYGSNLLATEVLTDITGDIEQLDLGSDESEQNSHFTMVRLEEILPNQRTFFNEKKIRAHLSEVVPAPFNTQTFTLGKKINKKLTEKGIKLAETEIFFEKQKIFRPPYSDDLFFNIIIEKEFKVNNELVAYGWLLTSKENKQLSSPNNGVFFKKKGVTIGDANLVIQLYTGNYNLWQYGEIHIIAEGLKENAPRNNFEANNDIIDEFYDQVGEFIGQVQKQNRYQSNNIVTPRVKEVKNLIDSGELKQAHEKISKLKKKLQVKRSFPKDPALKGMKKAIDKKSTENKAELDKLEQKILNTIKAQTPDPIKEKWERLSDFINKSNPRLKKHLSKTTKKGKLELNIDSMAPVIELLQEKTGLTINELYNLSRRAYDWKSVEKGDNGPILTLANRQPNRDDRYRGHLFGVMIYSFYNLFVNPSKHEQGKPSFAYYESMTEEEKIEAFTEFLHAQNLILRLIEKSKRIRDP